MTRLLTAVWLLLVLAGCATLPPMSASDADRMKTGKTTVLFDDEIQQINYLQDKYYVLAVTQEGSTSVYKGIWNSNKDLSALHVDELSKLGLRARSAYELFSEQDVERMLQEDRDLRLVQPKGTPVSTSTSGNTDKPARSSGLVSANMPVSAEQTISPLLRQSLLDKGQEYLIWATWTGYTLHIQTLGLPPNEQFLLVYRVFDVKKNKLLGGGQTYYLHNVNLEGQTGKDFLEKDNLAGLRSQVEKHIRERFTDPPKASIGKILGLQG
jgi:hypothetical protein